MKENHRLQILYQDEHCIAVNKPAGMLVHRSWLAKQENTFVMQTLRDQIGQHVYPVHRLDRPTSGVLLFALCSESAHALTKSFEPSAADDIKVKKHYLAVVRGWFGQENEQIQGCIDYPLRVIKDKIADKHSAALHADTKMTQSAITHWQALATTEQAFQARSRYKTSRYSLVKLTPNTGRKHQLRRHMKHVFHPIVGDTSYGDHHQNRAVRQHVLVSRMMLHAHQLIFNNLDAQSVCVTAPLDAAWHKLFTQFGWLSQHLCNDAVIDFRDITNVIDMTDDTTDVLKMTDSSVDTKG